MELSQIGYLEELLQAPRRDMIYTHLPAGANDIFSNGWNFESLEETTTSLNPSFAGLISSTPTEPLPCIDCPFSDQTGYPFVDGLSLLPPTEIEASYYDKDSTSPFQTTQEDHYPSMVDQDEDQFGLFGSFEEGNSTTTSCNVEMEQASPHNVQVFNVGSCGEKKGSKSKKLEGQPSKNLMAERRRRKRLNDRLSMLRSIVPKISKPPVSNVTKSSAETFVDISFKKNVTESRINSAHMDRTSILGDTIDYMKELLERISNFQGAESEEGANQMTWMNTLKEIKPSEAPVRNSPKVNVERTEIDTRIDICCAAKPGLLLSTISTLEALGLDIQQCVISCFNDFSMQASCSEEGEQISLVATEDIKQALFRTAGYGGRCL